MAQRTTCRGMYRKFVTGLASIRDVPNRLERDLSISDLLAASLDGHSGDILLLVDDTVMMLW